MKKYNITSNLTELKEQLASSNLSFAIIAGGTDKIVNRFQGNDKSELLFDISSLQELKHISYSTEHLEIDNLIILT